MDIKQLKLKMISLAVGGVLSIMAGTTMAGPVGSVTMFAPDEAAVAAEVNGNFTEHTTQINDNDSRIVALEAQIATLMGTDITLASMTGDYSLNYVDVYAIDGNGNFFINGAEHANSTIIFDGVGGFTLTDDAVLGYELAVTGSSNPDITPFDTELDLDTMLESFGGTYTISSTGLLSLTDSEDTFVLQMSPNLFMGSGGLGEEIGSGEANVSLFFLVKKADVVAP